MNPLVSHLLRNEKLFGLQKEGKSFFFASPERFTWKMISIKNQNEENTTK